VTSAVGVGSARAANDSVTVKTNATTIERMLPPLSSTLEA
jgi:hypothetical protein